MRIVAGLLVISMLLTGCIGGKDAEEAVDPADTSDTTTPTPSPNGAPASPRPASPTPAPSKPTSGGTAAANGTSPANATATLTTLPYAWDSAIANELCVGTTITGCVGIVATEGRFDIPTIAGSPTSAKLELAWAAAPGGIGDMDFAIVRATACEGDGCWEGEAILAATGASPLTLDTAFELAEGEFLVVVARPASMLPGPLFGYAHLETSFSVTGQFAVAS